MTEVMDGQESNRARVRRLLLGPLGFRSPRGTAPEAERVLLDGIADDLAYLTDDELDVLRPMVAVRGEGSARCFWPPRATFAAFAHIVHPRPMDQHPKLLSWWASEAGQRMVQDGTLVETYQYFEKNLRPPTDQGPRAKVAEQAAINASRLGRLEERERLGFAVDPAEAAWGRWYRDRLAYLTALVDLARARKMGQAA